MQHVLDFFQHHVFSAPFLIIGKGPSYSYIDQYDLNQYTTISLNHVIKTLQVDFAHLIDFDVFEECQNEIYTHAKYLILPLYPNLHQRYGKTSLVNLLTSYPVLKKLNDENRLLYYEHRMNALQRRIPWLRGKNTIVARYFSAEAVVSILTKMGVKQIYLIGVDGGRTYSQKFDEYRGQTLFKNGHQSFTLQFKYIRKMIMDSQTQLKELHHEYPIKVYIATQEAQMVPTKVLEYSIRKRTSKPVEVYPMHLSEIEYATPKNPKNRQKTPFSFQRFLIPQLNDYKGRAIYLDSDMQVFKDIDNLWTMPMYEHDLLTVIPAKNEGRRLQFSVMLLDCSKIDWNIHNIINQLDSGELTYKTLMHDMTIAKNIGVEIPTIWNSLEVYKEGGTALWHCTDMETQPWISRKNPNGGIWVKDLIEAIDDDFISKDFIQGHINKGWIRPSLMYQIENRILNSLSLPREAIEMDKNFHAPYESLLNLGSYTKKPYDNFIEKAIFYGKKIFRFIAKKIHLD